MEVDQDSTITITYKTQFLLSVNSTYGTTRGSGWYDEGSVATFSVKPTATPYSGFLGMLNVQYQFSGWTGDVEGTIASSSVAMDGPKTVQATWITVYGSLFFGFVGLIVGVPLAAVLLLYWKRRGDRSEEAVAMQAPSETETDVGKVTGLEESKTASPKETVSTTTREAEAELSETSAVKDTGKPIKNATMFCKECGAKIPRDSKFCQECGSSL